MTGLDRFRLEGRRALVTGGARGLGRTMAQALAEVGAEVAVASRTLEDCRAAADEISRTTGKRSAAFMVDLNKSEEITRLVREVEDGFGAIDILVNNAGMQRRAPLEEFAQADWHELMRTNVDSVFIVGQAVARCMIPRRRGKIVNICSVQSELGRPNIAPYTASKGAVKMLTKGMAIDWGQHGIQVNGLGPGYFKTELTQALVDNAEFSGWLINRTPSRRWGDVEDLVGAAVFLASDASAFVNGHILYVDGGVTAAL